MARKRQPRRRAAPRPARPRPSARSSAGADGRLLALARQLGDLARRETADGVLAAAVRTLAEAYGPAGPLARDLARAWERAGADEVAALSLAWAREQVRLALAEILARASSSPQPPGAVGETRAPFSVRAWVWLAACEALAREAPETGVERLRQVLELTGGAAPP